MENIMSNSINLKELEHKTYLAYHQDGLADITAGILVGSFGLDMLLKSSLFVLFAWMPIIFILPIRRAITYPRIGFVKFAPERTRKISTGMVVMMIAGVVSLVLGLITFLAVSGTLSSLEDFFDQYALLVLGAIIAGGLALVGLVFQIKRFYAYAVLAFGAWLLPHLLGTGPGLVIATVGAIILLIGVGLLTRFLIQNPRLTE
jgi:hypothetical protein